MAAHHHQHCRQQQPARQQEVLEPVDLVGLFSLPAQLLPDDAHLKGQFGDGEEGDHEGQLLQYFDLEYEGNGDRPAEEQDQHSFAHLKPLHDRKPVQQLFV